MIKKIVLKSFKNDEKKLEKTANITIFNYIVCRQDLTEYAERQKKYLATFQEVGPKHCPKVSKRVPQNLSENCLKICQALQVVIQEFYDLE